MRKSLITSAIAASVLTVGLAASAVQAGGNDPGTAPPDTIPGMDMLSGLGLDAEQTQCLTDNAADLDLNDMNAIMGLMTECGIDPMSLVAPTGSTPDSEGGTETTVAGDDTVDPAAAVAVLAMFGVDPTAAQCIEDGLTSSPATDEDALAVLQGCDLSLTDLLTGFVGLNSLAGGAEADASTPPDDSAPAGTGEAVASDNPMVGQIQDMLAQQDIELDDDQVTCLVDNIGDLDLSDMTASMAVFETCGISITELS